MLDAMFKGGRRLITATSKPVKPKPLSRSIKAEKIFPVPVLDEYMTPVQTQDAKTTEINIRYLISSQIGLNSNESKFLFNGVNGNPTINLMHDKKGFAFRNGEKDLFELFIIMQQVQLFETKL